MPTYRYRCEKCGEELEIWQSIKDDPITQHDGDCGGHLLKVLSAAGIVLKGPGFYKTDSRTKSSSSSRSSSSTSSNETQDGSGSGSGDGKSGDGKSGDSESGSKKSGSKKSDSTSGSSDAGSSSPTEKTSSSGSDSKR